MFNSPCCSSTHSLYLSHRFPTRALQVLARTHAHNPLPSHSSADATPSVIPVFFNPFRSSRKHSNARLLPNRTDPPTLTTRRHTLSHNSQVFSRNSPLRRVFSAILFLSALMIQTYSIQIPTPCGSHLSQLYPSAPNSNTRIYPSSIPSPHIPYPPAIRNTLPSLGPRPFSNIPISSCRATPVTPSHHPTTTPPIVNSRSDAIVLTNSMNLSISQ